MWKEETKKDSHLQKIEQREEIITMEEERKRNSKYLIRLPILLSLSLCLGIFIGATMFDNGRPVIGIGSKNSKKLKDLLNYIDKYYVDTVDMDELTEYAIEQMLTKLDPHTSYIPAKDQEIANSHLQGNFEGVGIEFRIIKDTIYVVSTIPEGPSEIAGIQPGDKLVEVDGENVAGIGISQNDVVSKLRGERGTNVEVGVKRKKSEDILHFSIRRDKIPTKSVEVSYLIDEKTGYIKISAFGSKTYEEFDEGLTSLINQGMERLILDLRNNGGGYMHTAISITDELLDNEKLIVYTKGKVKQYNEYEKAGKAGKFEKGPLIVLINENSASASEIVSGALQDNDRALIVGRRSFGKGLVQRQIEFDDHSELRLTISRYYTPSGRSIQKSYEEGQENYNYDLSNRFQKGEYFSADSIHFDESLKYSTLKGRTVYGGGGIMPDFFVPLDTSYSSDYLSDLNRNDAIVEFAYEYANEKQEELEKIGLENFKKEMYINKEVMGDFIKFAKASGVEYVEKDFLKSKKYIETTIKSLVARRIWGEKGFYIVYNKEDDVMEKAISLFDEAVKIENQ